MTQIYDITMPLSPGIPLWPGSEGFQFRWLKRIRKDGVNESQINLNAHTGTHMDAPFHFLENGKRLGQIVLNRLVGKAFVLECLGENPIKTEVLQKAPIPPACRKLLFKTDNSVGRLQEKPFQQNYVSLDAGAAEWLAGNNFDLVGIDYLSIEAYPSPDHRVHHHLLENDMILLEGLDLYNVPEGLYHLIALPLNIPAAEAVPVRAILLKEGPP